MFAPSIFLHQCACKTLPIILARLQSPTPIVFHIENASHSSTGWSPIPRASARREDWRFPLQLRRIYHPLPFDLLLLPLFLLLLHDGVCEDDDVLPFLYIARESVIWT